MKRISMHLVYLNIIFMVRSPVNPCRQFYPCVKYTTNIILDMVCECRQTIDTYVNIVCIFFCEVMCYLNSLLCCLVYILSAEGKFHLFTCTCIKNGNKEILNWIELNWIKRHSFPLNTLIIISPTTANFNNFYQQPHLPRTDYLAYVCMIRHSAYYKCVCTTLNVLLTCPH
jgi:hypothetical protein